MHGERPPAATKGLGGLDGPSRDAVQPKAANRKIQTGRKKGRA